MSCSARPSGPLRRPRPETLVSAISLAALCLLIAARASGADATGRWWADAGSAQVEITHCGGALCGRLVCLRSDADSPELDRKNPDPALRRRELVGIVLVEDLVADPEAPGRWRSGTIYDPASGRTYSAEARLDGPDRLLLRGYLGIPLIGRTAIWTRVEDAEGCGASK